MEKQKPRLEPETPSSIVEVLSRSSSGRRSSASNSPEFEFWMVRNPSFPQPQLLSADELFVDGVLLPLHHLPHLSDPPDPNEHKADAETPKNPEAEPEPEPEPEPGPGPESSAALSESSTGLSPSKRWRDIFKLGEKKTTATTSSTGAEGKEKDKKKDREKEKPKEKKKERKSGGGSISGTELNINIWPFSRSHSAGNSCNRPKLAGADAASRKVSSAPCSRSNSGGESKSRKWPSSPSRGGVHLGRSSPVWQVRRGGSVVRGSDRTGPPMARNAVKGGKKEAIETSRNKINGGGGRGGGGGGVGGGARARTLNLNVPMCIGYRQHLSCRSDENSTMGGRACTSTDGGGSSSGGAPSNRGGGPGGGSLMNLRTIFSKKVY